MEPLLAADPRQVGAYRLLGRLGEGGMGEVFLGESPGRRKVAVKLVRPEHSSDTEFRQRFAREVEAAKRVGGFHTAQVVDADPNGDPPWLVTAYIAGPSLVSAVERSGPLDPEAVRMLGAGLSEGVAAIHACGLVHRDLKPANIILAEDGPRIIDFGVARTPGAADLTSSGVVIGTITYMSPEQVRGERVDARSDVFSLGGVLAFAATGRGPFDAPTMPAIIHRIASEPPDLDGIAEPLRGIIAACLAKDPADRPALATLTAHLTGSVRAATYVPSAQPQAAPVPPPPVVPPPPAAPAPGQTPFTPERADPAPPVPAPFLPSSKPAPSGAPRRRGIVPGVLVMAVLLIVAGLITELILSHSGTTVTSGGTPVGTYPPSPVPSATGTPKATARTGSMPLRYVGHWTGTLQSITNTGPTQNATISVTKGKVGTVVGHASYPGSGCTYTFHLTSARTGKVVMHETVDSGLCYDEYVVLTPAAGQAGLTDSVYDGTPSNGVKTFTGHLTRAAASS